MSVNETPPFWFDKPGIQAWLMWPVAWAYSRASALKMHAKPSGSVNVPVLCIGNFVAGGGGKTPTALAMAKHLTKAGYKPGFLSRGYGGRISGPEQVQLEKHNAHDVGDEPLLLARSAPTVISAERVSGAKKLVEIGCDFIIMDDGFQNPRLVKDYSLVVVDSRRGIGNGFAMPAGPLRVRLKDQLPLADSVLVVGNDDSAEAVIRSAAKSGRPIYQGSMKLLNAGHWKDKWLLPFAGIADPEKFFQTLRDAGADLAQYKSFADHHFFTRDDVVELLDRAKLMEAQLVTTSKDFVRLLGMGEAAQRLAKASEVVSVELVFENNTIADIIIQKTLSNFEKRQLKEAKL
ncbi:MAG: tetraacyldisaccharide 4'-kinase [Salaquimonas sp.]